jgi:Chitobiase/beta-hexosaminidase C-terminal domain
MRGCAGVMQRIIVSLEVLAAIIAMTILHACAGMEGMRCAKPTLTPPSARGRVNTLKVTIKTATKRAYLRYTLDGSTPTAGHGTRIKASSGKVTFRFGRRGRTFKAIAYKAGWADSAIAVGNYVYKLPR